MVLNLGPQHPSTHGVLRVVVRLDGEMIRACDLVIGYLHRGTEKLGENARYVQFTPWTDRTDYISAPSNNLGYIMAVEKLLGITDRIPERAQYFRVILAELTRIASHLVGIGTHAMDIGALSMSLYTFREREMILDLFENYCGARLTTNIMEVGGFQRPIPDTFWEQTARVPARHAGAARRSTRNCSTRTRSGSGARRASATSPARMRSPSA